MFFFIKCNCKINFGIECAGPKQVKNFDVFMGPLIDELKILWNGVPNTYDAHRKELFTLKAILLWTMTDFLGMLFLDLFYFILFLHPILREMVS